VDCDVDFETAAADWTKRVIAEWKARLPKQAASTTTVAVNPIAPDPAESNYDKKNPFLSQVLDRIDLNGRGSDKHTLHIELSLTGSGIQYQPGDALGIVPRNDPSYVDEFLAAMQYPPGQLVTVDGQDQPLKSALVELYEVTTITRPFVKAYATATGNADLTELASPNKAADFQAYVHGREIIDLLQAHPPKGIPPQDFQPMLRRLQPRLYSIASSLYAHEEEVHLTVGVTKYESHGRKRHGVCSTYLGERLIEAEPVRVYPAPNPAFKLPPDPATPIIMIGPGTGVAPFRSFVEEREALGSTGKNWLFFGDQHFATDFLYQTEWQRCLKSGALSRMDVAFSRDQRNKIYVQHRMAESGRDFYAWLQDGAAVYVCGDASRMAADVNEALLAIVMKEGDKTREAAEDYLRDLHRTKRYQRDVY
jgi:sulfite reductase (NADPH) flavoprotein alpha-component